MPDIKFPKPRMRLKNYTRFIASLLVFLLIATAAVVFLGKIKDKASAETDDETAVIVTPLVLPPTPTPATPAPTLTPPPVEIPDGKTMDKVTIVIDAGHGATLSDNGPDPGTVSPFGDELYEKDITLDIAKRLKAHLEADGLNVLMTRDGDDRIFDTQKEDLVDRAYLANNNDATFFVSIHVNANDYKSPNGMEVYYYDKPAVFQDFDSKQLAGIIGKAVNETAGTAFNGTIENNYSVLRNTTMPAVLVETGYITNKNDHERLASEDFREKTAAGIANGIRQALDQINAFEYEGELYVFKQTGQG